ncbi:hypothetical protein FVE85_5010 [Porphyridium purpureum]|uniref:Trs120/TRAPPC9 N-terminal domain-containing protein n=1 Tax=Porphyridium purpureum TaxID=35688 RepID=A0A5J4YST6_PORPP|nr:hypothetical protein FVE85_5010 [Porphyridium purpureum]|eukprot:POR9439..scf236_6
MISADSIFDFSSIRVVVVPTRFVKRARFTRVADELMGLREIPISAIPDNGSDIRRRAGRHLYRDGGSGADVSSAVATSGLGGGASAGNTSYLPGQPNSHPNSKSAHSTQSANQTAQDHDNRNPSRRRERAGFDASLRDEVKILLRYEICHKTPAGAVLVPATSEWESFHVAKRIWGILGIADISDASVQDDLLAQQAAIRGAREDLDVVATQFKGVLIRKLLIIMSPRGAKLWGSSSPEVSSEFVVESSSGNNSSGSSTLRAEIRVQLLPFVASVLDSIERAMVATTSPNSTEPLLTYLDHSGASHKDQSGSGASNVSASYSGSGLHAAAESQTKLNKRRDGRVQKLQGDFYMLLGACVDALRSYNAAAERARANSDRLWIAGAMEGAAAALLAQEGFCASRAPFDVSNILAEFSGDESVPPYAYPLANARRAKDPRGSSKPFPPPVVHLNLPPDLVTNIVDGYSEVLRLYARKRARTLELSAALRLCFFLGNVPSWRFKALEVASYAVQISANASFSRKMHIWGALALFHDFLGAHRKAALFYYQLAEWNYGLGVGAISGSSAGTMSTTVNSSATINTSRAYVASFLLARCAEQFCDEQWTALKCAVLSEAAALSADLGMFHEAISYCEHVLRLSSSLHFCGANGVSAPAPVATLPPLSQTAKTRVTNTLSTIASPGSTSGIGPKVLSSSASSVVAGSSMNTSNGGSLGGGSGADRPVQGRSSSAATSSLLVSGKTSPAGGSGLVPALDPATQMGLAVMTWMTSVSPFVRGDIEHELALSRSSCAALSAAAVPAFRSEPDSMADEQLVTVTRCRPLGSARAELFTATHEEAADAKDGIVAWAGEGESVNASASSAASPFLYSAFDAAAAALQSSSTNGALASWVVGEPARVELEFETCLKVPLECELVSLLCSPALRDKSKEPNGPHDDADEGDLELLLSSRHLLSVAPLTFTVAGSRAQLPCCKRRTSVFATATPLHDGALQLTGVVLRLFGGVINLIRFARPELNANAAGKGSRALRTCLQPNAVEVLPAMSQCTLQIGRDALCLSESAGLGVGTDTSESKSHVQELSLFHGERADVYLRLSCTGPAPVHASVFVASDPQHVAVLDGESGAEWRHPVEVSALRGSHVLKLTLKAHLQSPSVNAARTGATGRAGNSAGGSSSSVLSFRVAHALALDSGSIITKQDAQGKQQLRATIRRISELHLRLHVWPLISVRALQLSPWSMFGTQRLAHGCGMFASFHVHNHVNHLIQLRLQRRVRAPDKSLNSVVERHAGTFHPSGVSAYAQRGAIEPPLPLPGSCRTVYEVEFDLQAAMNSDGSSSGSGEQGDEQGLAKQTKHNAFSEQFELSWELVGTALHRTGTASLDELDTEFERLKGETSRVSMFACHLDLLPASNSTTRTADCDERRSPSPSLPSSPSQPAVGLTPALQLGRSRSTLRRGSFVRVLLSVSPYGNAVNTARQCTVLVRVMHEDMHLRPGTGSGLEDASVLRPGEDFVLVGSDRVTFDPSTVGESLQHSFLICFLTVGSFALESVSDDGFLCGALSSRRVYIV